MKGLNSIRREKILDLLRREEQVKVNDLTERLGVTSMTVWRDLKALEQNELLVCVHGGAVLPINSTDELLYSKRKIVNADLKNTIGKTAAQLIHSGLNIFLDGSTTAVSFAKCIKGIPDICVFTDSLSVFFELQKTSSLRVILLGGELQPDENTLSGSVTMDNLSKKVFDFYFFSAAGFSLDGIYNKMPTGFETKQTALMRSKTSVLLADSTKYEMTGSWKLCELNQIDILATDDNLSKNTVKKIEEENVKVILASTGKVSDIDNLRQG